MSMLWSPGSRRSKNGTANPRSPADLDHVISAQVRKPAKKRRLVLHGPGDYSRQYIADGGRQMVPVDAATSKSPPSRRSRLTHSLGKGSKGAETPGSPGFDSYFG